MKKGIRLISLTIRYKNSLCKAKARIIFWIRRTRYSIFLNRVHQKQSIYDVLLPCGLPKPYDHWHPAYVHGNHEQIFCGVCGAGMFFFFLALFKNFPFTNRVSISFNSRAPSRVLVKGGQRQVFPLKKRIVTKEFDGFIAVQPSNHS